MLPLTPTQIEAATADRSLADAYRQERQLANFSGSVRDRHAAAWSGSTASGSPATPTSSAAGSGSDSWTMSASSALPAAQLREDDKELKKRYSRGRRDLEHEFGKSMRYKSIRDLVSGDSGEVIKDLKPVWLMSPLSVSDTLPMDAAYFDVVIFDEASQITLEEAVPSIFRAPQAIVVGDEMQLPPTDFFSARQTSDEEEELLIEEAGEVMQYDLASNSFLNHAAKNLPSTMLGWHYRSRSESLISFSNWAFYDGRLLTVPEERLPAADRRPILIAQPSQAEWGAEELLGRSISFHRLQHGVYDKRRNRAEADYIARLVGELLRRGTMTMVRPEHRHRRLFRGPAGRDRSRLAAPGPGRRRLPRPARCRVGAGGRRAVRRPAGQEPGKHPGRRARHHHSERLLRLRSPAARC